MKIIKINDKLKINLDSIYSIQYISNENELIKFEEDKIKFITETYKDGNLPPLYVDGELYKPEIEDIINESTDELVQKYYIEFNNYLNDVLCKPEEKNEYILILSSGLKVNIDKALYDRLNEELEKYVINNENR